MSIATIGKVSSSGVTRRAQQIQAIPRVLTWTGVFVTAVGFLLIAIAWGKSAGTLYPQLQLPYLISAGCTGLGLVVVGVTLINLDAKWHASAKRREQMSELRGLLAELRSEAESNR